MYYKDDNIDEVLDTPKKHNIVCILSCYVIIRLLNLAHYKLHDNYNK